MDQLDLKFFLHRMRHQSRCARDRASCQRHRPAGVLRGSGPPQDAAPATLCRDVLGGRDHPRARISRELEKLRSVIDVPAIRVSLDPDRIFN
jgi:hypothetical protein